MHRPLRLEVHLLLVVKQPAFALNASAVSREGAVGPDNTMAWHHHANRVGAIGKADSTNGSGTADAPRELSIRNGGAAGNIAKSLPDLALEGSAGGFHGNVVDGAKITGEVGAESTRQAVGVRCRFKLNLASGKLPLHNPAQILLIVGPEGCAQSSFTIRDDEHVADGGWEPVEKQYQGFSHATIILNADIRGS